LEDYILKRFSEIGASKREQFDNLTSYPTAFSEVEAIDLAL